MGLSSGRPTVRLQSAIERSDIVKANTTPIRRRPALALIATAAALAAVVAGGTAQSGAAPAAKGQRTIKSGAGPGWPKTLHPSDFVRRVDNPWFPLKPGTKWIYRGSDEGDRTRDVVIATYRTRVIDGVRCRIVLDRVWTNGRLDERTRDFYAQTKRGTVWYFGERTATLNRHGGVISREGSFLSGVGGAEAGVFMTSHPRPGPSYFQEYFPGHAMDRFTVVRRDAHVSVPLLWSDHALLTRETTPLEPGVVDHKYYVRDVGSVREVTVTGGSERLHLAKVAHLPRP
jgi:hypothetical protein